MLHQLLSVRVSASKQLPKSANNICCHKPSQHRLTLKLKRSEHSLDEAASEHVVTNRENRR